MCKYIDYNSKTAYLEVRDEILNQIENINKEYNNIIIVNVGTDRSIGDSLAPLVGKLLSERKNIHGVCKIYGTIDNPVHAKNIGEIIKKIDTKNNLIIGIDASLGKSENIGKITINKEPIRPGLGVGKVLPNVGDFSIMGVVNEHTMGYSGLMNTRLSFIINMAQVIEKGLNEALKIHRKTRNLM